MTISPRFRAAMNASSTDEVVVALATVIVDGTPELYFASYGDRISDDPLSYAFTSRSQQYDYLPMEITLPSEDEKYAPEIKVNLDNVAREAIPLLRQLTTVAQVTIELVLKETPDYVELSFPEFDLSQADYTATTLSLSLTFDAMINDPFPAITFNPSTAPGLF